MKLFDKDLKDYGVEKGWHKCMLIVGLVVMVYILVGYICAIFMG
jgi:hypothetical protein